MNALSEILSLPEGEKGTRGLVHTPAEIAQQPNTWRSTFELFQKNRAEITKFLASAGFRKQPGARPAVIMAGAGTSDYIGHSLSFLLRKTWQCEVAAIASTDLLTHMDELILPQREYLWISFSRSGDSPEGVAVLQKICERRPDIHHLIVSCNSNGRMIRENAANPQVRTVCLDDAVNDRGLAMTSSFSNMVIFGHCLAHAEDLEQYEAVLSRLIETGSSFLPRAADCAAALAEEPFRKACFVGSGPLKAVARESALKLLELTAGKVTTMSESALGLRHGPMAALDQDTLFVSFLSGRRRVQEYERELLLEVGSKRLVKTRVVVGGDSPMNSFAEHCIALPGAVEDDYRPPLDVIFGQLLGLFFSLRWKLQPDCPSPNGAISRVVQNVSIHS